MNKNKVIGLALVASAAVLACVIASSNGGVAEGLVGKAVWYLPYAVMVGGVQRLIRARWVR